MTKRNKNINEKELYSLIIALALKLFKDKNKYSRADVAFELKNKGIACDSAYIEDLIVGAYEASKSKEVRNAIKNVFYNNSLTRPIIVMNSIKALLHKNSFGEAIILLNAKETEVNALLKSFNKNLEELLKGVENYVTKKDFLSTISGAKQVSNVKSEAEFIFTTYKNILLDYNDVKQSIIELIEDYSLIRAEIAKTYRNNVTQLTDVFGENIKSVDPSLFDFSRIEWVDTNFMQKSIQFEFDNLMNSCSIIISEINENFKNNLAQTFNSIGQGGDNKFALAMAGLEIMRSWTESGKQATKIRRDLENMRQKMDHDVSTVKGDLLRIKLIDKTMRDVYIPASDTFRNYLDSIFSEELKKLLTEFYKNKEIKELKSQKDSLLEDYNQLENELIDHQNEIQYYTDRIKANKTLIKNYSPLYIESQNRKPSKPFFLLNIFSLGSLNKKYNRDIYEWHQKYNQIIKAYNETEEEIKLDKDELKQHKYSITKIKPELSKLKREIELKSQLIFSEIKTNDNIQVNLSKHLVPLINLLRTARKVIELKIDEKYLKAVKLDEVKVNPLPLEMEERINNVISTFREGVDQEVDNTDIKEMHDLNISNEQEQEMKEKVSKVLSNAIDIVEETASLKKLELQGTIARYQYNEELNKLRDKFINSISKVENRAKALQNVMKNVQSGSEIVSRDALIELIDENDKIWISEKELIEKFKNNKTITI